MAADFALDRHRLKQQFAAAALTCDAVDVLARTVGEQMDARLNGIVHTPQTLLDLGCGTGRDLAMLARRYPEARQTAADLAPAMLARI
ncbi:MAG: methyltransferase domain-containing protein, partial [Rhodocyclaceae bacterium]|nr:methyltransferase domain-containing protein [Rhodocyclaceae bacterium]